MAHGCKGQLPDALCGKAINYCIDKKDGEFWAGNKEYESRVNYCPYCGEKAPKQTRIAKFSVDDVVFLKKDNQLIEVRISSLYFNKDQTISYSLYAEDESIVDSGEEFWDAPEENLQESIPSPSAR